MQQQYITCTPICVPQIYGWDKNQIAKCILERGDHPEYKLDDMQLTDHKWDGYTHFWQAQVLILVSGEEVRNHINKIGYMDGKIRVVPVYDTEESWQKSKIVVASTDPSLGLPAIPQSYIKHYVENNGNVGDVRVALNDIEKERGKIQSRITDTISFYQNDSGGSDGWYAHYGSSSLESVIKSMQKSMDSISLLKLTRDNEVIILPDESVGKKLDRLSSGIESNWSEKAQQRVDEFSEKRKGAERDLDEPVLVPGENGERILKHLEDKKVESQKYVDTKAADKELEDAAIKSYADNKPNSAYGIFSIKEQNNRQLYKEGYINGYKSHEEQSANEAVEFAEWKIREGWTPMNGQWKCYEEGTKLTSKQLYELWQQNK